MQVLPTKSVYTALTKSKLSYAIGLVSNTNK